MYQVSIWSSKFRQPSERYNNPSLHLTVCGVWRNPMGHTLGQSVSFPALALQMCADKSASWVACASSVDPIRILSIARGTLLQFVFARAVSQINWRYARFAISSQPQGVPFFLHPICWSQPLTLGWLSASEPLYIYYVLKGSRGVQSTISPLEARCTHLDDSRQYFMVLSPHSGILMIFPPSCNACYSNPLHRFVAFANVKALDKQSNARRKEYPTADKHGLRWIVRRNSDKVSFFNLSQALSPIVGCTL
jgi:hypothetical protein